MKDFRSTWLMLLIVGLLAGYTLWDYRKAMKDEGVDLEQEKKLFTIASDDVSEVGVVQNDSVLELKKEGALWLMKKPIEDEADSSAVEAFIYSALIQKGKFFRTTDESKATNWAEYGLEPAGSTLELKTPRLTETLQVSSKNAFDGSFYVRKGDELLLGDRGLAQLVGRSPNSLRNRRLWRDTEANVERADIEVNYGDTKEKFSIVLKGNRWEVDPKPAFTVDYEKTANWLVLLERFTAQEVVADIEPEPSRVAEAKRSYLLTLPSVRAVLHYKAPSGQPGTWTFTAGQDRDEDVFVMSSVRPTVYKVAAQNLKPFRSGVNSFRDGRKPFQFPVEQARKIEVYVDGKLNKFIKDGATWKLDGEGDEVQTDRLVTLVQNLYQLEALEFFQASQAKGFKPTQRLVVRGEDGGVLLEVSWGDIYSSRRDRNKGMTFRFAKTNLEKDAMGVSEAGIQSLNLMLNKKK